MGVERRVDSISGSMWDKIAAIEGPGLDER